MPSCVQRILIVPVFLGLVGCAGASGITPDQRGGIDELFRVATVDDPGAEGWGAPVSARDARAFGIQARLVGADGGVLQAPRLTVYARQRANVTILDQTAYVETFDVQQHGYDVIADPVVSVLQSGVVVELCAAPDGDDALLAYRVLVSDLVRPIPTREVAISSETPGTVQLPKTTCSEVAGVRLVAPGLWTRLATLSAGSRTVDLDVRLVPAEIVVPDFEDRAAEVFLPRSATEAPDFPAEDGDAFPLQDWLTAAGDDLRIDVDALVLPEPAPVGEVLDAGAAERYGLARARTLRGLSLTSRSVAGAAVRASLDEAYVADYEASLRDDRMPIVEPRIDTLRSGLEASVDADGRLSLSWVTAPRWSVFSTSLASGPPVVVDLPELQVHERTIDLQRGARLVTLGRTEDGGTLAVRVVVGAVQRRVASQTQATRKRRPPSSTAR